MAAKTCAELFGEGGALNQESFGGKVPKYWTDSTVSIPKYWNDPTIEDKKLMEDYTGCVKKDSFFGGEPLLDEGVGYAIVLGFGIFFSIVTTFLVFLDKRYVGVNISSEFFNTAGRTVKTGLTAAVIVSQWTWAATLLQSSNVAYQYGVSGPFWYASGATIQVLLFGILAIEVKRKAPNAHTILEIIDARWGETAHKVFMYFCFMTNIIVSAMLILGGAATVNALTGMNTTIAGFLIPLGVIAYTVAGGLKATFMASYLHTAVIYAVLCLFVFMVYTSDEELGSADKVFDRLKVVAYEKRLCKFNDTTPLGYAMPGVDAGDQSCGKVAYNRNGSYLTMLSNGGLEFGIINIIGNFGTVFVDQSYWQSAIAAKPSSSHKGYLLGGLVWFAIPFSLATAMGLSSVALDLPVTSSEAGAGLVPPAAAVHFMGDGGGILITIMLFMAIVSTGSAEQIAVSSLVSYDVYRRYINPAATGEEIVKVSRFAIVGFGIFMGVLSIILYELELSLSFVYLMMGIFIGSAVIPVALVLTWSKATAMGAIAGAFGGQIAGIISWVVSCKIAHDKIDLDSLGTNHPMLTGNLFAILTSGAIHVGMSLAMPDNFDFALLNERITLIDDALPDLDPEENDEEALQAAQKWISQWGIGFTVVMIIIWPVLSVPAGEFTRGYFNMWVVIAVVWGLLATVVIVILPIYESWNGIVCVIKGLFFNDDLHVHMDDIDHKLDAIMKHMNIEFKPLMIGEGNSLQPAFRAKALARGSSDLDAIKAEAKASKASLEG
jgi:SSS family transporter